VDEQEANDKAENEKAEKPEEAEKKPPEVTDRPRPAYGGGPGDSGPVRFRLPRKAENEIFGIADQLLGASRIKIMCADGKSRMGRIPGKLKKRMWIRVGDLVIVRPWKFQDDKSDIVWRYTKTQANYLSRRKIIPDSINIF
jgi:translation initiation factor 1A